MTGKPIQKHTDRSFLFSQRYGYRPLPSVMDYTLCKEFRDRLCAIVSSDFRESKSHTSFREDWLEVWRYTEQLVLEVEYRKSYKVPTSGGYLIWADLRSRLLDFIAERRFDEILSFIEISLRFGVPHYATRQGIPHLFGLGLAPYAIDSSATPICIIPVDTPENADNIVAAIETLHDHGAANAHQSLRNASKNINDGHYKEAVDDSIDALESVARSINDTNGLPEAVKKLSGDGVIHSALAQALNKLFGFASDTARHGQPEDKPDTIAREEALLTFSVCASVSAYLLRKHPSDEDVR